MRQQAIRATALCVIRHQDRILAALGYTAEKGEFFRPLGGGINFGERSRDAAIREVREEIQAELTNLKYLGLVENLYLRGGVPAHELIIVYTGEFADPSWNQRMVIQGMEEDEMFEAEWVSLSDFTAGRATLFPDGLLALLVSSSGGLAPSRGA
ncbi:MAG: NUDIX domain-containing protein [Dehalococcoidia bacterium]|nr:NUDIX domain-containing protein [Dehalococcoidia bacterium]